MTNGADKGDLSDIEESELVEEAMKRFNVDVETARRIVAWITVLAKRWFDKWQNNYIRRVMERLKKEEEEWKIKMGLQSTFEEEKNAQL